MFDIKDGEFHVYYPVEKDPEILYINGEKHKVPPHVHKAFAYLTVIDKEVYINGYVYDHNTKVWHVSSAKKFVNMILITIFAIIMFIAFT
jgi:hypothetical protein